MQPSVASDAEGGSHEYRYAAMMSSSANGIRHGVPCDSSPRGRQPEDIDVSGQSLAERHCPLESIAAALLTFVDGGEPEWPRLQRLKPLDERWDGARRRDRLGQVFEPHSDAGEFGFDRNSRISSYAVPRPSFTRCGVMSVYRRPRSMAACNRPRCG
jgi:hypothetical protein